MANRIELHNILKSITPNVYYQPPGTQALSYPAIVYSLRNIGKVNANNSVYDVRKSYLITVIDRKADSPIVDKITLLDLCTYDRHFVSDGLYHDTFVIYY